MVLLPHPSCWPADLLWHKEKKILAMTTAWCRQLRKFLIGNASILKQVQAGLACTHGASTIIHPATLTTCLQHLLHGLCHSSQLSLPAITCTVSLTACLHAASLGSLVGVAQLAMARSLCQVASHPQCLEQVSLLTSLDSAQCNVPVIHCAQTCLLGSFKNYMSISA